MIQESVSVILLAGGAGRRMESELPKQFLPLGGRPIALHSFVLLASLESVHEVIVVCSSQYRHYFLDVPCHKKLIFASPGKERQDSAYNGLCMVNHASTLVCIHDAARPLINQAVVQKVLFAASQHGAAALAVPVKATIKQGTDERWVAHTLNRDRLWEMQTPQVIRRSLLAEAYDYCHGRLIQATDDVSLVEQFGRPVKLVEGTYSNIKITTRDDLLIAQALYANAFKSWPAERAKNPGL